MPGCNYSDSQKPGGGHGRPDGFVGGLLQMSPTAEEEEGEGEEEGLVVVVVVLVVMVVVVLILCLHPYPHPPPASLTLLRYGRSSVAGIHCLTIAAGQNKWCPSGARVEAGAHGWPGETIHNADYARRRPLLLAHCLAAASRPAAEANGCVICVDNSYDALLNIQGSV